MDPEELKKQIIGILYQHTSIDGANRIEEVDYEPVANDIVEIINPKPSNHVRTNKQ